MEKLLALLGVIAGGWGGWWLGAHAGEWGAVFGGAVGSGVGIYWGRRIAREHF